MNPYALLIPVFLLCMAGAGLSYSEDWRQSRSYVPWMVFLGAACAALFAYGARLTANKEETFVFSLIYDALVAFCYVAVPILFLGCRLSGGVVVGTAIMLLGLVVLKVSE